MSELLLPQAPESEQLVLGAFMHHPREVGCLCAERKVEPEWFHIPAHAMIYRALESQWNDSKACDFIAITQILRDREELDRVGGAAFVTQLFTSLPTAANTAYHIEVMEEKRALRLGIVTCSEYSARSYHEQDDAWNLLGECASKMAAIAARATERTPSMKELLFGAVQRIQDTFDGKSDGDILPTGIEKLDRLSPLRRGDMPLISGERKAGKSILALTIAANIALTGLPVLYFSLEDPAPRVIDRLISGKSRVPLSVERIKGMTEGDFPRVQRAVSELANTKLIIRDDVYDLSGIVGVARQTKIKHPDLAAIVLDYGQLVRAKVGPQDTRQTEVAHISRTCRLLSMELHVALLLLTQLNKEGDTRESKALEQDATAMWKVSMIEDEPKKRLLSIPFQRNGESGIGFNVSFLGDIARVENLIEEEKPKTASQPPRRHWQS